MNDLMLIVPIIGLFIAAVFAVAAVVGWLSK